MRSSELANGVGANSATRLCFRDGDGADHELVLDQATDDALRDAAPWRTFRWHYGQRHYSGSYWAATMFAHVIYETRLELTTLLLADFDASVNHIVAQRFLMKMSTGAECRRRIPVYLLLTDDGPVVVDVKPADLLDDPAVATTFDWVRAEVQSVGWSFEVASEQPRVMMENVRFLAGYRWRAWVNDEALDQVRADGVSVREAIRETHRPEPLARSALLHLLWIQELRTDLT